MTRRLTVALLQLRAFDLAQHREVGLGLGVEHAQRVALESRARVLAQSLHVRREQRAQRLAVRGT